MEYALAIALMVAFVFLVVKRFKKNRDEAKGSNPTPGTGGGKDANEEQNVK